MSDQRMIHIVDDEESIRKSLSFMLKAAGFEVRTWPSGVAFLHDIRNASHGCVLLDVRMPELDGLEVQAAMIERGVGMPVIVLTGHGDITLAVRAMKAGAVDFLEKPFERNVLLDAIARAFDRIDGEEKGQLAAQQAQVRIAGLTGRERDVLDGLVEGLPNKTIAYDLGISPRTVEVHRANLMIKLGVNNFSDALRIAFAAGLGTDR